MIKYNSTPEFKKDFKRLLKAYRSLETDLETMKELLLEPHFEKGTPVSPKVLVAIPGYCKDDCTSYKVRKFTCDSMGPKGGSSGLRIIFVYQKDINQITFVEIYYKGSQENEDKKRLQNFIENIGKTRD